MPLFSGIRFVVRAGVIVRRNQFLEKTKRFELLLWLHLWPLSSFTFKPAYDQPSSLIKSNEKSVTES